MPINTKAFHTSTESIFNKTDAEAVSKLSKTINLKQLQNTDDMYTFALISEQNINDDDLSDLSFKAICTNEAGVSKTLSLADFNYEIDKKEKQIIYHINNLKDKKLCNANKSEMVYSVNYGAESLNTAKPAAKQSNFEFAAGLNGNGKMANQVTEALTPIYYTDSNNLSIPVYTKLEPARNYYRSVLVTMAKTPHYTNLKEYARFPKVSNVWQYSGNLTIQLNESDLTEFSEQVKAKACLNNLVKSFEFGQNELTVNKISISIDGARTSKAFGGIDIARDYPVYHGAKIFLPYVKNEETIWYPIPLQDNADFDALAKSIVEIYKNPNAYGDGLLTQLIPDDVELESATIEGKTARFNFSDNLLSYYENNLGATAAFCEGMALTFSSLPYIENYEIYINDKLITQIGDAIVYNPVGPPVYYNVDKDYLAK